MLTIGADIPANSKSATIIKVRIGASGGSGLVTLNGKSGSRRFGGVASSLIIIKEYSTG